MATIFRGPLFHLRWEIDPTQNGVNAQFGVQFNINLFPPPAPQIPPGETYSARPDPIYWSNTWTQSLVLTTLAGQDKMTVGEQYTERPQPVDWRAGQTLSLVLSTLRSQDAMTTGEQLTELPPTGHIYPQQLRTWLQWFNLNLVGKDRFPPGEQLSDLPPRDHARTEQTRTWTFTFNPNLAGQDFFPPGRTQHTTRPDPIQWYQNWTLSLQQSTLIPAVQNPFGPYDWSLPLIAGQPQRGFEQSFNLNLIGQDFFPPGKTLFERPQPVDWRTSWTQSFPLSLRGKDAMVTGDQLSDLPPRAHERQDQQRMWSAWFNLNLVGQDRFPPGEQYTERPPGPDWRNTWSLNLLQTTLTPVTTFPFGPYDWPNPKYLEQPLRSYQQSFNLNLIGQDSFPPGKRYFERPAELDWRQGFTYSFPLNLRGKDIITVGDQLFDLPPRGYPSQDQQRTWLLTFNPNLVGQDAMVVGKGIFDRPPEVNWRSGWTLNLLQTTLIPTILNPFNQLDWPNPRAVEQPNRSFHHWFNLNLIDTNLLLFRQRDWPNPKEHFYPTTNRTWLSTTLELLSRIKPFNQLDWPLPQRYPEPPRSYQHSSLQLISMVRPLNQYDWPLPNRYPEPNRSTQFSSLQFLTNIVVYPAGQQLYDLPPTGHIYPTSLRFLSNSPHVPEPIPPVGGNFEWIIRARRRHRR